MSHENCKSSSRCQKCNKKHHTSICEVGLETPHPAAKSILNPKAAPFVTVPTTTTFCSDNMQTVFLQTARATIHHLSEPHNSIRVRIILDGGSQKSYLSERARHLLKLEPTGEQAFSIATFGSSKGTMKVCPIVNVGLCLRGYPSVSISLYVMPTICESLVGQPISTCINQHPHLSGLELADFSDSALNMPVDMLIGSDYYWQLVTGSICRGTNGPVTVHTKLGWVLSGPSSLDRHGQCSMNLTVTQSITDVLHSEISSVEQCTLDDQL